MTRHHDLAWRVDRGGSVSRLRSPRTRYRFGTFTLRALAPLLLATVAHAQPATWQTYRDGSITRYQGTDAKGGQWTSPTAPIGAKGIPGRSYHVSPAQTWAFPPLLRLRVSVVELGPRSEPGKLAYRQPSDRRRGSALEQGLS